MAVRTKADLRMLQAMPLDIKVAMTQERIRAWVNEFGEDGVCVAYSGGKDSTVLLHLVRELYPDVRAVFSNTGLEYPEIRQFAMSHDKVDIVYPDVRFVDVLTKYGYPLIGKEVAEAIYYARRIGGGTHQEETHRVLSKTRSVANSPNGGGITKSAEHHFKETCRQRERLNPMGGVWYNYPKGQRRRHELHNFGVGVANGRTTQGGVFNNPERYGEKSQFDKSRYLPIARDLPVKVSHYCCNKLKKAPMKKYQHSTDRKPILGTMAEESRVRMQGWIRTGCNAFDSKEQKSQPMSFWTEQDVLRYIVENDIPICSVYGDIVAVDKDGYEYPPNTLVPMKLKCTGCDRTGCIYCAFGFHNEKGETRFQRLAKTHPKQYEFALGGGGGRITQNTIRPHRSLTATGKTGTQRKYGLRTKRGWD